MDKTQHGKTIKKVTVKCGYVCTLYGVIRDIHVQNVNRNALKVAIECQRERVHVRIQFVQAIRNIA